MTYTNPEVRKAYERAYYAANKEKVLAKNKKWIAKNKEKILNQKKEYFAANKEKIKAYKKSYYEKNKIEIIEKARIHHKVRRKLDAKYKMTLLCRKRLHSALKAQNAAKNHRTLELLGTTIAKAYAYLESLFQPGMSWDNHGEWHIDHIIPCASFDLTNPAEQKKCFHYTNLQPLWAADNLSKGASL